MATMILSDMTASISELKNNPASTVESAHGGPIAILNRNKPAFYCVPCELWEKITDMLEDIELNRLADERAGGPTTRVNIDEL